VIPRLAERISADAVCAEFLPAHEELVEQAAVEQRIACPLLTYRGQTLIHPADLPMPPSRIPFTFTSFRTAVEKNLQVRDPLPPPDRLPSWPRAAGEGGGPAFCAVVSTAQNSRAIPVKNALSKPVGRDSANSLGLPSLADLGLQERAIDPRAAFAFEAGGEGGLRPPARLDVGNRQLARLQADPQRPHRRGLLV
jgi:hypothetical protein